MMKLEPLGEWNDEKKINKMIFIGEDLNKEELLNSFKILVKPEDMADSNVE